MVGIPSKIIRHHIKTYGWYQGILKWAKKAYLRERTQMSGVNVFSRDWDVLVVLDACRPDLLNELSPNFDFLDSCTSINSVGSATAEWMPRTFGEATTEKLSNTIYICGNPFSKQFLSENSFSHLEEVWRWGWDTEIGTVPPRPITDTAINLARERSFDRLLIHYMQPHAPFLDSERSPSLDMSNFTGEGERTLDDWELADTGKRDIEQVWEDYKRNLEIVLEDVSLLRENIEAEKMIITSDHGNAVGERGLYGHPGGVSIPALHNVPWCETKAADRKTRDPESYDRTNTAETTEELLSALGYK